MESSSLILFAGALGVTSLLVAVLYFLYKFLMRETPYQRTFLVSEVDSRHNPNDKKVAKKAKNSVRQRITSRPVETLEKVGAKDGGVGFEKSALNAVLVSDNKVSSASEAQQGNVSVNQSEKVEPKKKSASIIEKVDKVHHVSNAGSKGKKSVDDVVDESNVARPVATSKAILINKDEKLKTKIPDMSTEVEQQQDKREEKKVSVKQVKELPKQMTKDQDETYDLNFQQQAEKKKKNKKSNEENGCGPVEQKMKLEASIQTNVHARVVTEEVIVEQKVKHVLNAPLQQQLSNVNKKKITKAKTSEESDVNQVVDNTQVIHSELKQKAVPVLTNAEVLPPVGPGNNSKQLQQINVNKVLNTDLESLKRLVSDKDAVINRDQMQLKTLNDALFQMKKELASERSRFTELETSLHGMTKKHNDEKQQLLNSFHQKDQQSKQTIQLLQQDLQTIKSRPNDLSIIMSNLAEENAKLKGEIGRAEKQVNDEMSQRMKAVDRLNESLRKLEHSEMNNSAMELKYHEAEERIRSLELKQKEKAHLEKVFYDLQQEHQHLKMQSQPNIELQNQLRTAKLENEEIQSLVDQLKIRITELEKDLISVRNSAVVTESVQQQTYDDLQTVNGCSDADHIAQLETKLSEQDLVNRQLMDKLNAVDKKNKILESERGELLVALEKLKRQVVDLEKELESAKTPPPPLESLVVEQNVEVLNPALNGCEDSELIAKLEARLAEKDEECQALIEKTKAKDVKIEDLRNKNWKAMEALAQSEKRLELIDCKHESSLKELQCLVEDLKAKLVEAEQKSIQMDTIKIQQALPLSRSNEASERNRVNAHAEVNENPETENVKQLKMVARTNQICLDRQEEEINILKRELLEQRNKNDKLREKNWTIMTSLNESEKRIKELYKELEHVKEELVKSKASLDQRLLLPVNDQIKAENVEVKKEYTIVNEVKESCQWDMSQLVLDLDTKTAELEILQSILDQHENSISILKAQNEELKRRSGENGAEERINDLEQKVEHYKSVLVDTESILRTLEASVNAEENKWKSKAEKLEREVVALRQRAQ